MSARILLGLTALLIMSPVLAEEAKPSENSAEKPAETAAPKPQEKRPPLTKEQKEAVESALKTLRKLQAATSIGLNVSQYGDRLIDVKADVDEQLRKLPAGLVKTHFQDALQTYQDARDLWYDSIRWPYKEVLKMTDTYALIGKYKLPWLQATKYAEITTVDREIWLSLIWASGRSKTEQVETEVSQ